MKKVMFIMVGMLFSFAVSASTVELINKSFTGGGSVADGNGVDGATASHTNVSGEFEDIWEVTLVPAAQTALNIATTIPVFDAFDAFYSNDSGNTWFDFDSSYTSPLGLTEYHTFTGGDIGHYLLKVTGFASDSGTNSYQISISSTPELSAVPVPAALFLFAPALLGFLGYRRKASQAA